MSQQPPLERQSNASLARIPESSWARILLIFIAITACWQLLIGSQISIFWSVISIITVILVANTFENLQFQITFLQKQIFELQQQESRQKENHQIIASELQKKPLSTIQAQQSDIHASSHITDRQTSNIEDHQDLEYRNRESQYLAHPDAELEKSTIQNNVNQPSLDVLSTQQSQPEKEILDSKAVIFNTAVSQRSETPKSEHQTSLKELKMMTSLWDAAINWFKGGNSIVRIAIVILLIGVVLLLRFASEYWSLTLSAKMTGVAVGGFALTALGYVLRKKRFDYAISLQGAGLGIIFLVLFSSYHLQVIQSIAISYVALMTLLAATLVLALRQNALFLAFIALGSGFIAPFILNTGSNDIPALMAYLFVLNFALAIIAYFKPWRILNTLALLITFGIGGFAIWFNATDEQYFQISCWVWAIFALYLFISIRYSQHIVKLNTKFKDIPFVDTSLIFATPFMAFSLYAGLVDSDGHALSLASGILAVIYIVMGYVLQKQSQQLSMLSQCFYGLGFVFTALILPFAFDAYWTSVGWAIHGIVVLYLGWRYGITSAKYFGSILLLSSGIATIFARFTYVENVLFATSILMLSYAFAAYFLKKPHTEQPHQGVFQILAWPFIFISFSLSPYVYKHLLEYLEWQMYSFSLPLLLWFVILSLAYWFKEKVWQSDWKVIASLILLFTAVDTVIGQVLYEYEGQLFNIFISHKIELALTSIAWLAALMILFKALTLNPKPENIIFTRVYSTIAIMFLAILGGLWASAHSLAYFLAIFPILILLITLKVASFKKFQIYWVENIGIAVLTLVWLYWISLIHTGEWVLPYIVVLNPVDLSSILVFGLIAFTLKPYLLSSHREFQIPSAIVLLCVGLLLISSLMLRMLNHYAALPYWSANAWDNSVVQASLTILWASTALILTTLASQKSWRYIWMLGIAVLAIVIAKLIFLDLSHSHTLTRIVSFIGSGLIMLVIGYFSPLPPKQKSEEQQQESHL